MRSCTKSVDIKRDDFHGSPCSLDLIIANFGHHNIAYADCLNSDLLSRSQLFMLAPAFEASKMVVY